VALAITVGHREIEISRPDKQLIPPNVTKAGLARYYAQIGDVMLPHIAGRPLNFERYPDGIEGHKIFQQHASGHFPDWIEVVEVPKSGGTVKHVVASEPVTLVYLANQACITFHSWESRADNLGRPDKMVFDLDPSVHRPAAVRRAALLIVGLLRELGLEPWAMTSGSRGYHVVVPLQRRAEFDYVRTFSRDFAAVAAAREPRVFTIEQRKAKREGKILIDFMRNGYGLTSVAPYSVRARPKAPVATPLHLDELSEASTRPDRWTVRAVLRRVEQDGDPWERFERGAQTLTAARRTLDGALAEL